MKKAVAPLQVRITSPLKVVFEGTAQSVSSTNIKGPFDVLPYHANFITLIENAPIVVRQTDGKIASFTFNIAIMYAKENRVDIYTEIQG